MTATTHAELVEQLRSTRPVERIAEPPLAPPSQPAEPHPQAGVAPQWARVPTVDGGHVLAGPNTGIPLPPSPPTAPAARPPQQPAPVDAPEPARQRGPGLRARWVGLPRKYQWATAGAGAVLLGLGVLKWVVPWVSPDPDVVVIQTPGEQPPATTAPAATGSSAPVLDPLGWGPGDVALSARALIGVGADGVWRNAERANDVARQAQQLVREQGSDVTCALRLTVPAPGRLTVTLDTADGSVPLFVCEQATTTTAAAAGTTLPIAPAVGS